MKLDRGSRSEWVWLGGAVVAAVVALTAGRGARGMGSELEVEVTIVPADAVGLGCAGEVAGARCAFDAAGAPVAAASPLRPFVSTSGQLVALSGVFESAAVKGFVEGAAGSNTRMRVRCQAKLLAASAKLGVRFRPQDPFNPADAPVLEAKDCRLEP